MVSDQLFLDKIWKSYHLSDYPPDVSTEFLSKWGQAITEYGKEDFPVADVQMQDQALQDRVCDFLHEKAGLTADYETLRNLSVLELTHAYYDQKNLNVFSRFGEDALCTPSAQVGQIVHHC